MILRNSLILAFFSILSLLLGVWRDRLLAQIVGVGPMLDVYNAAFRIPDLVYGILLSAVSAATVVPFITKGRDDEEDDIPFKFNSLFFFFGAVLVIFSIAAAVIVPYIAHKVVPGFDEYQIAHFVTATRILLIQPLFLGLSALISSLAQVRHRFILYSVAPLFYTLTIIASIPLLYPSYGIYGIVCGVVIGALISLIIQCYTLYESRIKFSLDLFRWEHVKNHVKIALPRSMSTIVSRLREIVFTAVATSLGVGVLSVYLFAQRISDAFVQVVVQSAATAALPILSHKHARGEHKDYARILKVNLLSILSISIVASIVVIFLSEEIVRLVYGDVKNAHDIAVMARYIAFVMPIYAVNMYFANAFNASKETMGLFLSNLGASVLGAIVLWLTSDIYGPLALAVAGWAVSIAYLLLLTLFYSRKRRLSTSS
jgi:putative peptidoglycan lipid II flippase